MLLLSLPGFCAWTTSSSQKQFCFLTCPSTLVVLDRILGQQLLDLVHLEKLKRRLHDAVEQKGEVDEQHETDNLQPLERLPAEAERDDPDE